MSESRPLITVFTATFNRAHTLPRLQDSLLRQSVQAFEWLVIDDGSTDGTGELLTQWEGVGEFKYRHIRVDNGGKPRAITEACRHATGEYLFIVDSDDYLVDDAIERLESWIGESRASERCVGVGGMQRDPERGPRAAPGDGLRGGFVECNYIERERHGLDVDMNEAYRVDVLRNYPFPVWPTEKFVPESVVFDEMALDGWTVRWHWDVLCVSSYRPDGLTANAGRLEALNPMGYATLANSRLKYVKGRWAVRSALQHVALSLVGGHPSYILRSNRPLLTLLLLIPGAALSFRRRRQFRSRLQVGG